MRSRSSVLVPGRLPWSRSACRTQLDSVCAVQPILAAIDTIAAHCDACSVRCSNTIRTARSRTSLENFGDFDSVVMAPVSQELEPPANPGRLTPVHPQVFGCHHPNTATPRQPTTQMIRSQINIQYRTGVASL